MLWTKSTIVAIIVVKPFKFDNVLINVVIVITTRSQVPEQQVLKECEPMKVKTTTNWQKK
jgi:hypothetical protein